MSLGPGPWYDLADLLPPELVARPLVFVDLETTGAHAVRDRVTEIGVVRVAAGVVQTWSSLVHPERDIPPHIQQLTGIRPDMVEHAPRFARLLEQLEPLLEGAVFVAHNARFDYGFMRSEYQRLGRQFQATVLCTVKLSRLLDPQHHQHSLDALIARHALPVPAQRHRALADAEVLWALWQRWAAVVPRPQRAEALQRLLICPRLPPQLAADSADDWPEAPGAYVLYGADDQALFVGRSSQLRQQVLTHFESRARAGLNPLLVAQVRRIETRETAGALGAELCEIAWRRHLQPLLQNGHAEQDWCAWRVRPDPGGRVVPELVWASQVDLGAESDLFGVYGSRKDAHKALRQLALAHQLCLQELGLESLPGGTGAAQRPCPAVAAQACRGVCIGREDRRHHAARLFMALAKLQLPVWPWPGPMAIREHNPWRGREDWILVDRWCHLGTVEQHADLADLLAERPRAVFHKDVYRVLRDWAKQAGPDAWIKPD